MVETDDLVEEEEDVDEPPSALPPPIINREIGAHPLISSAPSDAPDLLPPPGRVPPKAPVAKQRPEVRSRRPLATMPLNPLNETERIRQKIDQDYWQTRMTGRAPVAPAPRRNVVKESFATKQQDYQEKLQRFNSAEMYRGQTEGRTQANRDVRSELRSHRVEAEEDPDSGIVRPARDESGQVKFIANTSPQLKVDEQLHGAATDALGLDIYRSAEAVKSEVAKNQELAKLKERREKIPSDDIQNVVGTRAEAAALDEEITKLEEAGYGAEVDDKTGLLKDSPKVSAAKRAHTELGSEREAWGSVKPKTLGQLDQLLDERRAKILERGGNPDEDRIIQAVEAKRTEIGGQKPEVSQEEKALRKDPAYAPILARRDTLDEEIKPLQSIAERLITRLERVSGADTGLTSSQLATVKKPVRSPRPAGGDPFARVAAALSYVEQMSDPAKRSQAEQVLRVMEPYLAQLRQMRTQRDGLQAQVEHRVREEQSQFETKLDPEEELKFREWKAEVAPKDSGEDYDLRGAFKAGVTPDPASWHWPDTFKKPNHPTFSNESVYAKDAPEKAGKWEDEKFIPPKEEIGAASQFVRGTAKSFLRTLGGALAGFGQTEIARQEQAEGETATAIAKADQPPPADAKRPGGRLQIFENEAAARAAGKKDSEVVGIRQAGTNKILPRRLGSGAADGKIVADPAVEGEDVAALVAAGPLALGGALKSTGEAIKTDPEKDRSFWLGDVPNALGSAAGFVGIGATAGPAATTLAGAALQMDTAYENVTRLAEEARAKGDESKAVSIEGKKLEQMIFQAPIGALEGIGVGGVPARWFKATPFGRAVQKGIGRYLFGGTREGLQESLQGALEDVSMLYGGVDETASPLDIKKRAREFAAGAIVGGPLEMVSSLGDRTDKVALEAQRKIIRDDATAVVEGKHPGLEGLPEEEAAAAKARAQEILQATEVAERKEGLVKPTLEQAHAEINGLQPGEQVAQPGEQVAPEQVEVTQHALRGLVKIATGQPIDALTTAERLALLKSPAADGMPRVEMVRGEDGKQKPVITDAVLKRVRAIAPETAGILPESEEAQRTAILSPPEARGQKSEVSEDWEITRASPGPQAGLTRAKDGGVRIISETTADGEQSHRLDIRADATTEELRNAVRVVNENDQLPAEAKTQFRKQIAEGLRKKAEPAQPPRDLSPDEESRAGALAQVLLERGVDPDQSNQLARDFVAKNGAGASFVRQKFKLIDEAEASGIKKNPVVEMAASSYKDNGAQENSPTEPGGEATVSENPGGRTIGATGESTFAGESTQTAEQAAGKPEIAGRTHIDDSIDRAFEQRKSDFQRSGISQITESDEPFGAVGVRLRAEGGGRELLVNRKIAREWFDKFGPEKGRQLIEKGFEEELKHLVERKVARDNGTDTAALYRDWAEKNPDQEQILAEAYGEGWAKYSDTAKSAELARMILQTRESGQTTEQAFLGPDRAAAVDRALKQFKEPVRLTERLRQHFEKLIKYLRGIQNPSKAILDHIKTVERFENELSGDNSEVRGGQEAAVQQEAGTLQMAEPEAENPKTRELFEKHLPLADAIARGYANIPGVEASDVQQSARAALARAARAFDPARGSSFAPLAKTAIRNELNSLYREQNKKSVEQTTLDAPLTEAGEKRSEVTAKDQIPDSGKTPADQAAYNESIKILHDAIDELPAKMRTVLQRLAAGEEAGDIARDMDLFKQGVSNLKKAAMRRIRGKLGEKFITGIDDDGILRMAMPEEFHIREALNPLRTLGVVETQLNKGVVNGVRWLGRAVHAAGDATRINEAISKATEAFSETSAGKIVDAAVAAAKRQFVPLGNVPTEAAAMIRERQRAEVYGSQVAIEWAKMLSGGGESQLLGIQVEPRLVTPANKQALDQVLRGEARVDTLPEALRPVAQKVRKIIDDLGLDLVEEGLLNPDTYERNRGKYLARFYLPKEMEQLGFFGTGRRYYRMILDRFKPQLSSAYAVLDRGGKPVDWSKGQFRFENAAARDAWFDQFVSEKIIRDPELNRLAFELGFFKGREEERITPEDLTAFETLPGGVQRKITDLREAITRQYDKIEPLSKEQLDDMGLIREPGFPVGKALLQMNHDLQLARLFNGIADRSEWMQKESSHGFTQMPDNARYGKLAGKWVLEGIATELQGLADAPSIAGQIYDTALQTWKKWKTVYNPATHGRNLIGNVMFADFAGVNPLNPANWPHYTNAIKTLRGKNSDVTLAELYKNGVLGGDFASQELTSILSELHGEISPRRPLDWIARIATLRPVRDMAQKAYRIEDDIFKTAGYLRARSMGLSPEESAAHLRKWFPYYDQVPNSLAMKLLKRGPLPFGSFYYEALRIGGRAMTEQPISMLKWLMVPSLITLASSIRLGLDDDDLASIAKEMRGQSFGWPVFSALMPWADDQGRPTQFDLTNINPYSDLLGERIDRGERNPPWWKNIFAKIVLGNPASSILVGLATESDPFFGTKLPPTGSTPGESAVAIGKFVGKTIAPPLTPGIGTTWSTLTQPAVTKGTLQKRNQGQAVARGLFGVDLRSAAPSLIRMKEDFAKANAYKERPDFKDSVPIQRARGDLYQALINRDPKAVAREIERLAEENEQIKSASDLQEILDTRHPLAGIKVADRGKFVRGLTNVERDVVKRSLAEFASVRSDAPRLLAQSRQMRKTPAVKPKPIPAMAGAR